jgi:hypothetical protein
MNLANAPFHLLRQSGIDAELELAGEAQQLEEETMSKKTRASSRIFLRGRKMGMRLFLKKDICAMK